MPKKTQHGRISCVLPAHIFDMIEKDRIDNGRTPTTEFNWMAEAYLQLLEDKGEQAVKELVLKRRASYRAVSE